MPPDPTQPELTQGRMLALHVSLTTTPAPPPDKGVRLRQGHLSGWGRLRPREAERRGGFFGSCKTRRAQEVGRIFRGQVAWPTHRRVQPSPHPHTKQPLRQPHPTPTPAPQRTHSQAPTCVRGIPQRTAKRGLSLTPICLYIYIIYICIYLGDRRGSDSSTAHPRFRG